LCCCSIYEYEYPLLNKHRNSITVLLIKIHVWIVGLSVVSEGVHLETIPLTTCIILFHRDMMSIYNEPPPGLFVVPDEKDITIIHALITGSFDTPYEGGFFYFLIRCPSDYPIRPPRVKLMTTGAGTVRFNPNLYKCGKICLSILG